MGYADLRGFLDDIGPDLLRIDDRLSPRHEIAAVLSGMQSSGKAVLIENVAGHPGVRVAGNLLGSRRLMARAMGTTEERLADTYMDARHHARAPVSAEGPIPVKEVVHMAPAEVAAILPILTHHEDDAAPYITCGVVLARDPETGRRAMGIHRMMVHGGNRLGILLANPPLSLYLAAAEKAGRPLEVAVALGVDPAMLLAAVIKVGADGPDKLEIAGGLRGHPLEMTPGLTVDLDIPARAEAVIEGRVLPGVRKDEGPFGENTGYYFTNASPVLEVSAILHRRDLIYTGLCPWTTEVDNLLSLAAGADLLAQLRHHVHGVRDLELVAGTCGFNAVLAVEGLRPHEVRRLILLALSLDRRLKSITVVDSDIDIRDSRHVSWALATRYQPDRDTVILSGLEGYVIDPSPPADGSGSKIGFDATRGGQTAGKRIAIPAAAMERAARVLAGARGA